MTQDMNNEWGIAREEYGYDSESYPCNFIVAAQCPYADLRFSTKEACQRWIDRSPENYLKQNGYKPFKVNEILNRHKSEVNIFASKNGLNCPICSSRISITEHQRSALERYESQLRIYLHCKLCNSGYIVKYNSYSTCGLNPYDADMVLRKGIPLIRDFEIKLKDWIV